MVSEPGYYSGSWSGEIILGYYAGLCDRTIYDENLPLGGVTVGSDGSKQIHAEDGVSVETPMGIIEGCEKWTCNNKKENSEIYFKKGLGIVKLKTSRIKNPFILESCNIVGGEGAIPTAVGNTWKYVSLGNTEFKEESMDVEITYSHDSKVIVKYTSFLIKHKCDENNFNEMINVVAEKYFDEEKNSLTPESKAIAYEYLAKAEKVACTELQKAHYSAAKNVIDRIFMEPDIKPDQTEKGICNFLAINRAVKTDGSINLVDVTFDESGERLVFGRKEWKNGYPMGVQCNFNYDLIQDILDCVWDDKWVDGYETVVKHDLWNCRLASPVKVTAVPSLTVAGEEYKNCLCVAFECKEQENSEKIDYDLLLGPKEYYYAPVVGIVRMVHHSPDGKTTTYDLTSYSGTGEGYFPMVAGMVRHYDAVDLDGNYRAYSEYTFAEDEDGNIKIYGDLCGMKKVNPEEK